MGILKDVIKLQKSSDKFDKVRGDRRSKWLKKAEHSIPGYSQYQDAKRIKDAIDYQDEGIEYWDDRITATQDAIKLAKTFLP